MPETPNREPLHKPLPELTDLTRPFWTAAKQRRFVLQKCARPCTRTPSHEPSG
jgi:hypothetical protein